LYTVSSCAFRLGSSRAPPQVKISSRFLKIGVPQVRVSWNFGCLGAAVFSLPQFAA
jgi:hypothetical protein